MKCKVGDKVKIKTWEKMEKKYGLTPSKDIDCYQTFTRSMDGWLNLKFPDRMLVIKNIKQNHYQMNDNDYWWSDDMIECLAKDYEEKEFINNRFEILDL